MPTPAVSKSGQRSLPRLPGYDGLDLNLREQTLTLRYPRSIPGVLALGVFVILGGE